MKLKTVYKFFNVYLVLVLKFFYIQMLALLLFLIHFTEAQNSNSINDKRKDNEYYHPKISLAMKINILNKIMTKLLITTIQKQ